MNRPHFARRFKYTISYINPPSLKLAHDIAIALNTTIDKLFIFIDE